VAKGRMRLVLGLTIIGAASFICGLMMIFIGETLRLKSSHSGQGLAQEGEFVAVCGLVCGVVLLAVLTGGLIPRAGRNGRPAPAITGAVVTGPVPGVAVTGEWLRPLPASGPGSSVDYLSRPGQAENVRSGSDYADDGWHPGPDEGWSSEPAYVWNAGGHHGWGRGDDWGRAAQDEWNLADQQEWVPSEEPAPGTEQQWGTRGQQEWAPDGQQQWVRRQQDWGHGGQQGWVPGDQPEWGPGGQQQWGPGGQQDWRPGDHQQWGPGSRQDWGPGDQQGWDRADQQGEVAGVQDDWVPGDQHTWSDEVQDDWVPGDQHTWSDEVQDYRSRSGRPDRVPGGHDGGARGGDQDGWGLAGSPAERGAAAGPQDPRLADGRNLGPDREDGQDLGPDREPETAGARPVPFLTGPEPTYLTGPDSGSLAEPRSADLPVSKPAVGEARMADDTSPLPVVKADGPPPSPPGLSEVASAGPLDRPGDTYRAEHAEPPSADTQEKIEQIKDLYLTAEAIGEDALGKHFDQLSQRQRSLIREFFEKAGLGSGKTSKLRGGDSAQDSPTSVR
jgi:hypothetical protein